MRILLIHSKVFGTKKVLLDNEDFERVNKYTWHVNMQMVGKRVKFYVNRYVRVGDKCKEARLHRFIMKAPRSKVVDHRDANPLNNQKYNLRICTIAQNTQSVVYNGISSSFSGYRGVFKAKKRWRVRLSANGKRRHIGMYKNIIDAAKAYNKAAIAYHGEFARLNKV